MSNDRQTIRARISKARGTAMGAFDPNRAVSLLKGERQPVPYEPGPALNPRFRGTNNPASYAVRPSRGAAPTVVGNSYQPGDLTRRQREEGAPSYDNSDDKRIAKARHANADFYSAVDRRIAQLKAGGGGFGGSGGGGRGSGGGGGGGGMGSMEANMLALAANPYDRALKSLGLDYGKNTGDTRLHGKRADKDLSELFARLGNYTGKLKGEQEGVYDKSGMALGQNYDNLLKELQGTYSKGTGNTTTELQRLGIQDVTPAAMSNLAQDAQHNLSNARIDKTNAQTNNTANKNTFSSLMQEMIGSAAVEGTTQRGKNKQATADQLNTLLNEFNKGKLDLSGKKGDALLQARLQIQQQRAQAAQQAANRAASLRAASMRAASGGKTAAFRKPSGIGDAMSLLQQYAGGDKTKYQDLLNVFNMAQGGNYDDTGILPKHLTKFAQEKKFDLNNPALNWHLNNVTLPNWKKKGLPYGPQDMQAIMQAINIGAKDF